MRKCEARALLVPQKDKRFAEKMHNTQSPAKEEVIIYIKNNLGQI